MLILMAVYVVAMWYFGRRLLQPASAPPIAPRAGRRARRPAPRRAGAPDGPADPASPAEAAETLLVRERLAGRVDAATYRDRMAALAAATPSWPPQPPGLRPSGR